MPDTKHLLDETRRHAPDPGFALEDVRRRKEGRERAKRIRAGVFGIALTAGLVVAALMTIGPLGDNVRIGTREGGGLPEPTRPPADLAPGDYSYQRILMYGTCEGTDPTAACADVVLHLESWWALDDSGRKEVLEKHGYGIEGGSFGPGGFPDEGDLTSFPTDPEALEAFLLDRSAPDGASPRPEVTPAPGVPLEEGLLWNSISDYLGSTQYLNATPALRTALLRVLARVPMVTVETGATDPMGRAATTLSFRAYGADVEVFVDPATGDFLAMAERYDDTETTSVTLVEEAGFTPTDDAQPRGGDRTIAPA